MTSSNQIDMRIIQAICGIIGVCITAANVLFVFVILGVLVYAGQVKAMSGPIQEFS